MATGSTQPFRPAGTVSIAASATSSAVSLKGAGSAVLVYNASAATAFFRLGAAGRLRHGRHRDPAAGWRGRANGHGWILTYG